MTSDDQAWDVFRRHRLWFNKLYVSERLGYNCGPGGTLPKTAGHYIVRPIYNLRGMGVGTTLEYLDPLTYDKVPPGYFWCEQFEGRQYSATYRFVHNTQPHWQPISCWEGVLPNDSFSYFKTWMRSNHFPEVPKIFNELSDVQTINVEFIGDKPIEVHLRTTPDPDYDVLIPIWSDTPSLVREQLADSGYTWIESYDNADGYLAKARLGFFVR